MDKYSQDDLKLIYRVLHRHLRQHPELLDSLFFEDLQRRLHKQAGAEGVDVVGTEIFKLIPRQKNDWRDTALLNLKDVAFDRLTVTNGSKVFELQRDATNNTDRGHLNSGVERSRPPGSG